jgi:hypothetical protein
MEHYKGEERILYLKINGQFLPIGCLSENSFTETAESFETTIKGEASWQTSEILSQSYSINFSGIQILTKYFNTNFLSYDTLKDLKRRRQLLEWKIQGDIFPIVDTGYCYITDISESAVVNELLTFSGTLTGFGKPRIGDGDLPIDCVLSDWSDWGECEGGVQTRTRTIVTAPAFGGNPCGPVIETRDCQEPLPPVDCLVSEWSEWGPCINGSQTRTRTILVSPANGGLSCPVLSEVRTCTVLPYTISISQFSLFASSTSTKNETTTITVNTESAKFRIGVKVGTGTATATASITINGITRTISNTTSSYVYSSEFTLTQGSYNSTNLSLTVAPASGSAVGDLIIQFVP